MGKSRRVASRIGDYEGTVGEIFSADSARTTQSVELTQRSPEGIFIRSVREEESWNCFSFRSTIPTRPFFWIR